MKEYFRARGYPANLVTNDLRKVSNACSTLLKSTSTSHNESTSNKVPLVLTYNPFNASTSRIMLDNFNILSSDPEARMIFPEPPLVSYRRERNLGDILVHSSNASPSPPPPPTNTGLFPFQRPRCKTCKHISSQTFFLQGPKSTHHIRDHFTWQSENIVYCISCRCNCLYIGETGRRLREHFSEHLRSIVKRSHGFPIAEHFNSASHSLDDIMVCGLKQCSGSNIGRKQHEMKLIFKLGTLRPDGLNILKLYLLVTVFLAPYFKYAH